METLEHLPCPDQTVALSTITYGPLREGGQITAGLDYYKPTMSQLAFEQEKETEVTFTFKNRGEQRLLDHIDATTLQNRLDDIRERGFGHEELTFFATLQHNNGERVFSDEYLGYLETNELPPVVIGYDAERDDIAIEATGPWPLVTFWETVIMSEINEAYFEGYLVAKGLDPMEIYTEGDRRLGEKIAILNEHPDIKFSDFGTRRHFSLRWQKHVLERLFEECPENIIGTSNVGLALSLGKRPIGTFAHEMPMGYAGLADARGQDIRSSHAEFLTDWFDRYGEDLSIALTDTFGTEFFFEDFTKAQAETWRGVRHDSGDAVEFGERLIAFYEGHGIDPTTKTIVFSDGLDLETIVALHEQFSGRVNVLFGWGTTLTNDLGLKALNIVVKATHVKTPEGLEADTVKLSDNAGKHTGPTELVNRYAKEIFALTQGEL